jgi:hypothetical protein
MNPDISVRFVSVLRADEAEEARGKRSISCRIN